MNLRQKITPEEEMKSTPIKNGVGIYGIVDDHGIDQIYSTDDKKQDNLAYMELRCRYNVGRNARIFSCIMKKEHVPSFKLEPMELYNELKRRAVAFREEK